jgi:hypothetical protein
VLDLGKMDPEDKYSSLLLFGGYDIEDNLINNCAVVSGGKMQSLKTTKMTKNDKRTEKQHLFD